MTTFGSSVPGAGGGNGQPLPDIMVNANLEVVGANQSPNGAMAYCDGHPIDYANKNSDQDGEPQRYKSRGLGRQWFDVKLSSVGDFAKALPHKACITQQNADSALVLDIADPYFANGTSNSSETAYKLSREGATFDSVAEIPIGGPIYALPATDLATGPGSAGKVSI